MTHGLVSGDRLPDFKRLDHGGQARMLYDLHLGQPMALFVLGNPESPETLAELSALNDEQPVWRAVNRIALVTGTPAQCTAFVGRGPLGFTLLTDDGTIVTHLLGDLTPPPRAMTALVLDTNLRIIERLVRPGTQTPAEFLRHVAELYRQDSWRTAQVRYQQAPILFIPRVLDRMFCDELIALFEKDGGQPSGIAYIEGNKAQWRPDPSVKMRRDVYIKEGEWLERIRDVLVRRVLPEIKRCFNYQVTQHEVFKLVCYDAKTGGYFRPHRDNESHDTQHRRFAMTLNLNTGDYTGGQLHFPEFGSDLYEPERGGAIVFSSSLLHEVTPVIAGRRYVLLGFFFGEGERIADIEYRDTTA